MHGRAPRRPLQWTPRSRDGAVLAMLWIVLMVAALVAGVFINRSMANWYARGLRQLRRRDAQLTVLLRKKRRERDKVAKTLDDLRETEHTFARLVATNEYARHTDPAEWLLQNKHISLSLYLKAKNLAHRREIDVVEACLELGAIDTKLAREAVSATCGNFTASGIKSGRLARAEHIEQARAETGKDNKPQAQAGGASATTPPPAAPEPA